MERGEEALVIELQSLSQRGSSVITCATLLLGMHFAMQLCPLTWSILSLLLA